MSKAGPTKKRGRPRTKTAAGSSAGPRGADLTVDDVARELAVSRRTAERLIATGEIAAYDARPDPTRGRRMLRVTPRSLEEFKAARTILTPGAGKETA